MNETLTPKNKGKTDTILDTVISGLLNSAKEEIPIVVKMIPVPIPMKILTMIKAINSAVIKLIKLVL